MQIQMKNTLRKLVIALAVITTFAGCLKNSTDTTNTCNYDACAKVAPAAEIQQVQDVVTAKGVSATKHCSGVFYTIDSVGTGKTPTPCSYVAVRYKGTLTNGTVFDQQTSPISFDLTSLIPAWRNTLPLIKEGGKIRLYVPPSLAYGSSDVKDNSGNVVIPANSVLIFEVSLVAVQ